MSWKNINYNDNLAEDNIEEELANNVTSIQKEETTMNENLTWNGPGAKKDEINHPSHYADGEFECIDVMMDTQGLDATQDFCILNAFKYLYRHRKKGGIEDLKKAEWYLNYAINLESKR